MLLTRFLFCPFLACQSNVLVVNLCSRECKSTFLSSTAAWKVEQLVARHFCRMFQTILTLSGCTTSTQLPLKFNELLTHADLLYHLSMLKLELRKFHQVVSSHATIHSKKVLQCTVHASKYFTGNFSRGKDLYCELNIPPEKKIWIIDLSAELPEC